MSDLEALILVFAAIALYFLPSLIGGSRGIASGVALFLVNVLFGWTVIGWVVCLLWAACGQTAAADAYYRAHRNS